MAITFVGSNTQAKNDGNPIAMSLPATLQGDLVVVFTATRDEAHGGPPFAETAYTEIADLIAVGPVLSLRFNASYKFMGSLQDTVVGVPGTGSTSYGTIAMALVFRGVSPTTPLDVAVISGNATGVPRAPAIAPINNNCCIVIAATSAIQDSTVGSVTNYLPSPSVQISGTMGPIATEITAAAAYRVVPNPVTQTPSSWSTWTSSDNFTLSFVLRPLTVSTDFNTVDPGTVTVAGKTVTGLETVAVSKATIDYVGNTITTPDARVESIFVDASNIGWTGKTVNPADIIRGIDVTKASVLYRGRTVTPRDIQFEDIPRYAVKGRGSGHWMETR